MQLPKTLILMFSLKSKRTFRCYECSLKALICLLAITVLMTLLEIRAADTRMAQHAGKNEFVFRRPGVSPQFFSERFSDLVSFPIVQTTTVPVGEFD